MIDERDYDSSDIWRRSRYECRVSQEYLANYIGVSRKTIQNWESGVSAPDFNQGAKWFEALGINPLPYFLRYMYPDSVKGFSPVSTKEEVEKSLKQILDDVPEHGIRMLLYLFYGAHGSSPQSVLNLITAYLHLPIRERVGLADLIMDQYEMMNARDELVSPEYVRPDFENVKKAISAAKTAAIEGKEGYRV